MNKLVFVCTTHKDETAVELAIRTVDLNLDEFVITSNGDGIILLAYKDFMSMENVIIKNKMAYILRDLESK